MSVHRSDAGPITDPVGVLYNSRVPAAEPLADEICHWLEGRGHKVWLGSVAQGEASQAAIQGLSLLLVLGGDGSTLHASRLTVGHDVPILGVNLGRVGFLSEAQRDDWPEKLQRVLDGAYWLERRLMVKARLQRREREVATLSALNDIVIGRGSQARLLQLQLHVDGDLVTHYNADALIVATPTGSTAYAMAAGGPLLPPQLQNFVIVPVAAHLSLDRALILHEEAEITVTVEMKHEAMLTADGQQGITLENGDEITVVRNDDDCLFARVESSGYFYRRLMGRLGYGPWPGR